MKVLKSIISSQMSVLYSDFVNNYNKNARALKVNSVIYWSIYAYKWASYFSQIYVSNVQNSFVFFFGWSNLTISAVFLVLKHYLRFRRLFWTFKENGYFMDVLTSTSNFMHIFMLRGSNAIIFSYSFQLLHHFRFWRPFWIFLS